MSAVPCILLYGPTALSEAYVYRNYACRSTHSGACMCPQGSHNASRQCSVMSQLLSVVFLLVSVMVWPKPCATRLQMHGMQCRAAHRRRTYTWFDWLTVIFPMFEWLRHYNIRQYLLVRFCPVLFRLVCSLIHQEMDCHNLPLTYSTRCYDVIPFHCLLLAD